MEAGFDVHDVALLICGTCDQSSAWAAIGKFYCIYLFDRFLYSWVFVYHRRLINNLTQPPVSRRLFLLLLVLALFIPSAWALDSKVALSDYHHDIWTGKDGAPAEVSAMAQTVDGWLWIGSSNGLYRFDG